jgi:hypothetical protein
LAETVLSTTANPEFQAQFVLPLADFFRSPDSGILLRVSKHLGLPPEPQLSSRSRWAGAFRRFGGAAFVQKPLALPGSRRGARRVQPMGDRIRGFYRVAAWGKLWERTAKQAPKKAGRSCAFLTSPDGLRPPTVSRRTLLRSKATLEAEGGNPGSPDCQILGPQEVKNPQNRPPPGGEDPPPAQAPPQPGPGPTPRAPCTRVRPARYPAGEASPASGGSSSVRPTRCATHRPASTAAGRASHSGANTNQENPRSSGLAGPGGAGLRHPRAPSQWPLPCPRPLPRSGLALGLCPGSSLQARPSYRSRPRAGLVRAAREPPRTRLFGHGSEFEAEFARLLNNNAASAAGRATPKPPKRNAHAECFHRTLQGSFADSQEEWLFTDLALFNRKLADGLVFDNSQRPDPSLGSPSPRSFLGKPLPRGQRYGTHTGA